MRVLCTCGKTLRVGDDLAGKTVRCPACKRKLKIEAETEEIEAFQDVPDPHVGEQPSSGGNKPVQKAVALSPLVLVVVGGLAVLAVAVTLAVLWWPRG